MKSKKYLFNLIGLGFNLLSLVIYFVAKAEGGGDSFYFTCAILAFIAAGFYIVSFIVSLVNIQKP